MFQSDYAKCGFLISRVGSLLLFASIVYNGIIFTKVKGWNAAVSFDDGILDWLIRW